MQATSPEHPALANARHAVDHDAQITDGRATRLYKAVMLAPTLETCRALLEGQHVPVQRLDPSWARRYGLL